MPPSQPTSPITPSRKRRSLRLSSPEGPQGGASPSPYTSGTTSFTSFSRRSSRTSQTSYQPQSPCTPRPKSSRSSRHSLHRPKSSRASVNSTESHSLHRAPSGLDNLADELDQVWDGDEADLEHQGSSFLEGLREGDSAVAQAEVQSPYAVNDMADFGLMNTTLQSPTSREDRQTLQIPPSPQARQSPTRHRRQSHNHNHMNTAYDGSDYGSDHDEEELSPFPPLLRKRMREIERISRDSHNRDSLAEGGGTVARTVNALRELGPPQSNVEYGITKVSTAYLSMATHRNHKQREIFALSHSLLYGNAGTELPEELLNLLISEIDELTATVPFLQGQNPLLSLQILASQTSDLTQTLRNLTDLLQESKLATIVAQRKLKSVREMVEDMRVEDELVDQSILLIQMGDWDRRCRERQAGKICREVVKGFGERWDVEITKVGEVGV